MTKKESLQKLNVASEICHISSILLTGIAEVQKKNKETIMKDEFLEGLWDMSIKDLAKICDTLNPSGGSLPESCKAILID